MSAKDIKAAAASIADLEAQLAALKGQAALESFADEKVAAEKAGFKTLVQPAHNGGQPALRIDY